MLNRLLTPIVLLVLASLFGGCDGRGLRFDDVSDQQVYVGEFLRVSFRVRGTEGRDYTLEYSTPPLPFVDRWAYVVVRPDGGEFQWSPTSDHVGDHEVTLFVDNGDSQAATSFRVEVIAAREAAPVFTSPGPGGVLDLSRNSCLETTVAARDRDTPDVMLQPVFGLPEGATFTRVGPGESTLRWCPTADQAAAAGQWVMTFEASDGEHDPVLLDYRVLLLGADKATCEGVRPTAEFVSPEDGDGVISRVGYDITIAVDSPTALRDRPVLFYTDGRIEQRDRIDLQALAFAPFIPQPDGLWSAYIPSYRLAEDEAKTIALVPWLTADTDPTGARCDLSAELTVRAFTAIGAVEAEILEECERCLVSGDCMDEGVCIRTADGGRCVPSCAPIDGTCEVGVCAPWSSMEGVVRFGCGTAEAVCGGERACVADGLEPNDSRASATPLAPGASVAGTACERDDDWFEIPVGAASRVRFDATVSLAEGGRDSGLAPDLEVHLVDAQGAILAVGATEVDPVSLGTGQLSAEACVGATGPVFARVFSPTLSRGDYAASSTVTAEACACVEDADEPDSIAAPRPAASSGAGVLCGSNADVFRLPSAPASRMTIALEMTGGDVDIEVLRPDGALLASSRGIGATETVSVDLPDDAEHLLRVFSFDGRDAEYAFSVSSSALSSCVAPVDCADDEHCAEGLCRRTVCTHSADCGSDLLCPLRAQGVERTCVHSCAVDADCPSGEACKSFFEGRACAPAGAGVAGERCTAAAECAGELTCLDWPEGYCAVAGCERDDARCGPGSACAVVDGRSACVTTCWVSDTQCSRGEAYACRELFTPQGELVFGCSPPTR